MRIKMIVVAMLFINIVALGATNGKTKKEEKQPDWYLVRMHLNYYGAYYRIPERVLTHLAETETSWKSGKPDSHYVASKQVGKAGELGPMQIKLRTARKLWHDTTITRKRLLSSVPFNIRTGCALLEHEFLYWRTKYKSIDKIWLMTLTSYNLGRSGAIKRHGKPNNYAVRIYS